ncbi:unnamed protein product [Allacma fusca]|uniref:Uncharacterized protein n=1 Tax=Allacma fusca TaxID=39272 RepID=A0A8J2KG13_9HEXA|nr:unnamed protein product [Allacma fusca]
MTRSFQWLSVNAHHGKLVDNSCSACIIDGAVQGLLGTVYPTFSHGLEYGLAPFGGPNFPHVPCLDRRTNMYVGKLG